MRAVRSAQVQRSGATGRRSGRKALTNAPVRATLTPIGWLLGECRFKAIFGLCSIKQFFSIREPEIAQQVSDLCGQKTADNITENTRGESVGNVG